MLAPQQQSQCRSDRRRVATRAAATLAATLCCGLLSTAPAVAAGSATSLPVTAGHTCHTFYAYGAACAELAVYTAKSGKQFITLQAEVGCWQNPFRGPDERCGAIDITGTVANAAKRPYSDWTTKSCNQTCQDPAAHHARTYFYPFGGLAISPRHCDNNVWGVITGDVEHGEPSSITRADDGPDTEYLGQDVTTPHYDVCETPIETIRFTRIG